MSFPFCCIIWEADGQSQGLTGNMKERTEDSFYGARRPPRIGWCRTEAHCSEVLGRRPERGERQRYNIQLGKGLPLCLCHCLSLSVSPLIFLLSAPPHRERVGGEKVLAFSTDLKFFTIISKQFMHIFGTYIISEE